MTAAQAFLDDILRHPDDDTPRLIFADWLEDQGDPASIARSDFIRIQCRLAKLTGAVPERAQLQARSSELEARYGAVWAGRLDRLVQQWWFHRGFIAEISSGGRAFLRHVGKLFRLAPIQCLRLHWPREAHLAPALAECRHLEKVWLLSLDSSGLDSSDVQALAASKHLTRLRHLDLSDNQIGGGGVRALIRAPLFAQLTHLYLQHNHLDGASARLLGQALLELAERGELVMQCLDLRENSISWLARRAITSSPLLRKVVRLD